MEEPEESDLSDCMIVSDQNILEVSDKRKSPCSLYFEDSDEGSHPELDLPRSPNLARRGKTRSIGITRARKYLAILKDVAKKANFNSALESKYMKKKSAPASLKEPVVVNYESIDTDNLRAITKERVTQIMKVATKSGNLKGGYVKAIKDAAKCLQDILEVTLTRS